MRPLRRRPGPDRVSGADRYSMVPGPHKHAKQANDMVAGLHGPKLSVGYGAPTWGRLQEVSKLTWPERTANIHRGRGSSPWDRPSCRREGKRGSPSRATCARHVPMVWSCQVSSAGQRGGTLSHGAHTEYRTRGRRARRSATSQAAATQYTVKLLTKILRTKIL